MLTQIHISHLITIENLELDLSNQTTVITGESGVGKSILIDAIELALGKRANNDMVRPGQEKADICLCFDLTHSPEAKHWLQTYDLLNETNECLIRRTIYRDGRSRSYINQMPTTLQPLRELSECLMNIHGQHEHQALLKNDVQRLLLDRYAGHEQLVSTIQELSADWHRLQREKTVLLAETKDRTDRMAFLKYQLQELEELHLVQHEFTTLDQQHKQLTHAEELLNNTQKAILMLSEQEEGNSIYFLNQVIHTLETIQRVDPKISTWVETLKNLLIQLAEIESELQHYHESIEIDPKELQSIEQRISDLFNMARKHKIDPHELYEFQQNAQLEYQNLEQSDNKIEALSQEIQTLEKKYFSLAKQLSDSRIKASQSLEKQITHTMQTLALPHGKFKIHFEPLAKNEPTSYGLEKILFYIQTNPDQPVLPLSKIASGGELSRIALAIHIATAKQQTIPTLIFDEVDVGVSGHTAEVIGRLLRQLGNTYQVLCVTHSPQVAAQGHQHLKVEKSIQHNTTFTSIKKLSSEERTNEIARMLGGIEITKKALAHAKEMIQQKISEYSQ